MCQGCHRSVCKIHYGKKPGNNELIQLFFLQPGAASQGMGNAHGICPVQTNKAPICYRVNSVPLKKGKGVGGGHFFFSPSDPGACLCCSRGSSPVCVLYWSDVNVDSCSPGKLCRESVGTLPGKGQGYGSCVFLRMRTLILPAKATAPRKCPWIFPPNTHTPWTSIGSTHTHR